MIVGHRIQERIIALSTSQGALAREIGVSRQAIGKLVRGETNDTGKLYQIARFLRTSPEFLTGETDDDSMDAAELAMTNQDREWLDLIHSLSAKDRDALLQLAKTIAGRSEPKSLHDDDGGELRE
jgi:transcriptional regulator with XRE-family HTH domain